MKILKFFQCQIHGNNFFIYEVNKVDCFKTFNGDFITDGKKYILGNKVMEFHIEGATYVYLPKINTFLTSSGTNLTEKEITNILKGEK